MTDPAIHADSTGERLRKLRLDAGLTQDELADRAGLTARTVRNIEGGRSIRLQPATRRLLAQVLGLDAATAAWLFGEQPDGPRLPWSADDRFLAPLVGRGRELAEGERLLADGRCPLLTVTGPGGVGKTRLARELAARLAARGRPVREVLLAGVSDPADVLPAVAAAVAMAGDGDGTGSGNRDDLRAALAASLGDRPSLLLLDNLEHLLDAAPDVAWLLRAAPSLSVIATSREPLAIAGERVLALDPLDTSSPRGDAVRLFVQQAERVDCAFAPDAAALEAIREICRRVGGLPLAIELAAAQMDRLSPRHLLQLLDAVGLRALADGPRDAPARQASMDAMIGWSWDLLTPEQRTDLETMAVFAGAFDLDILAAVLTEAEGLPAASALARAASGVLALTAKSLVRRQPEDPFDARPRHALLEPIRAFALGRLRDSDREDAVRRAHAHALRDRFAALYVDANGAAARPVDTVGSALDRMERDHTDARTAFDWALAAGDRALASELLLLMMPVWVCRDWVEAGNGRIGRLLAAGDALTPTGRMTVTFIGAELAFRREDAARVRAHAEAQRDLARSEGVPVAEAGALLHLSSVEPDPAAALALVGEAAALLGPDADYPDRPFLQAWLAGRLGIELHRLGRLEEARDAFERGIRLKREQANWLGLRNPLAHLALVLDDLGEPRAAARALVEAVALGAAIGDAWAALRAAGWLADLARRHAAGDPAAPALAEDLRSALRSAAERGAPGLAGDPAAVAALDRAAALPDLLPERGERRDGPREMAVRLE